jgi:hypothetical protein
MSNNQMSLLWQYIKSVKILVDYLEEEEEENRFSG